MSPIGIALITLACTFGFAYLGTIVRAALPSSHMSKESQDVVRLGMGLVATMTALLLGLVTAAAKNSFDAQDAAIRTSAVNIIALDRYLARYGPETKPIRDLLRRTIEARIEMTWPKHGQGAGFEDLQNAGLAEQIETRILALSPGSEVQRWSRAEALKLYDDVMKARWRVLESRGGSVPVAFLVVVILWLAATFASFGLYAPRNATVLSVLFVASISVAAAVFLILELDSPFSGVIRVSSGPLQYVVAHLGE